MATKLGSCHGSKFPIPFIEKNNETPERLALLYFSHQSVLLFQVWDAVFCCKNDRTRRSSARILWGNIKLFSFSLSLSLSLVCFASVSAGEVRLLLKSSEGTESGFWSICKKKGSSVFKGRKQIRPERLIGRADTYCCPRWKALRGRSTVENAAADFSYGSLLIRETTARL